MKYIYIYWEYIVQVQVSLPENQKASYQFAALFISKPTCLLPAFFSRKPFIARLYVNFLIDDLLATKNCSFFAQMFAFWKATVKCDVQLKTKGCKSVLFLLDQLINRSLVDRFNKRRTKELSIRMKAKIDSQSPLNKGSTLFISNVGIHFMISGGLGKIANI